MSDIKHCLKDQDQNSAAGDSAALAEAAAASDNSGIEVRATLLKVGDREWRWAVVVDRVGSDEAPNLVGFYDDIHAARSAAWHTARQLGGIMVYPPKRRGKHR